MKVLARLALLFTAPFAVLSSGVQCRAKDVEISADGTSYYVPSRCTALHVDGDTESLEKFIAAVELHPSLTSLNLMRDPRRARFEGGVGSVAVATLLKVLPNSNIDHLSLAFNRVGDANIARLAAALKDTKLNSLDLENTDINGKGATALASALQEDDTELVTINLSHNNVGAAAEALIEAAKTHSKLTQIGDEGTSVGRTQSLEGHAIRTLLKGECVSSSWSEWSECNPPGECGTIGSQSRSREIAHLPHVRHNVKKCPHNLEQARSCMVECGNEDAASYPGNAAVSDAGALKAKSFREASIKAEEDAEKAEEDAKKADVDAKVAEKAAVEQAAADEQAAAEQAAAEKAAAEQAAAEQAAAEQSTAEQTAAEQAAAEQSAAEQAAAEQTAAEQAAAEQAAPEQTAAELAAGEMATETTDEEAAPAENTATENESVEAPDYRTRLEAFYLKYNPSKASGVDGMLARYQGREDVLFNSLIAKYGPEP